VCCDGAAWAQQEQRSESGKPQPIGRRVGIAHDVTRILGHEIWRASAKDVETPLPHITFTRRLNLEGCEPVEDMMRVAFGDRRNMILFARSNDDADS
jgi:hypothetical protein